MNGRNRGEVERFHIGVAGRVARWSLAAWAAAMLGAIAAGPRAAAGMALGGALSLGLFSLHRVLVATCVRPEHWRKWRVVFWSVWVLKWPAVGTLLYLVVKGGWVSPMWLCAGVALVPGVATALAVRALIADGLRKNAVLDAGR